MINATKPVFGYGLPGAGPVRPGEGSGKGSFLETLKSFTAEVDQKMKDADLKAEEFAVEKRFDLHEITIAAEKADISFRLLMQIRNKLLEAYQEVMRMQF